MSRRPLVALLLVIGLASCGVEVFGSGGQTTLETTSSTSLATTTSIAPTTTAPTPTTEPVDACVQAEPVARVFLDLVEFAMKDWEPIAANQVSGAEAAALLAELRGAASWPSGVSWTPHRSQTLSCEPSPGTSTTYWMRSSQASTSSRWRSRAAPMIRCSTTTVSRSTPLARRGPVRDGLGRVPDLARGTLPRPQPSGRRADRPIRVGRSGEVFVPVSGVRADATRTQATPTRATRSHVAIPGSIESRNE